METDLITVYYEQQPMMAVGEKPVDITALAELLSKYEIDEIVPGYRSEYYLSANNKLTKLSAKLIKTDNFFRERLSVNDITGEFPATKDEIIVSQLVAVELFGKEDCIGQTVNLTNGNGQGVDVKIVGINKTQTVSGEICTYIPYEKATELETEEFKSDTYIVIEKIRYERQQGIISVDAIRAYYRTQNDDDVFTSGNAPSDNTDRIEIAISSTLLQYACERFGINVSATDVLEQMNNKDLGIVLNGLHNVAIVGVFQSDNIDAIMNEVAIEYINAALPNNISVYISDIYKSAEITEYINEKGDGLFAISQYEHLRLNISLSARFFQYALVVFGALLAIVSFFMLHSLVKLSLNERIKEIAILKSLGATNKVVALTLILDILFILILSVALAMLFSLALYYIMPIIFSEYKMFIFTYPVAIIMIIGIAYLFLAILFSLMVILKAVKTPPSVLIKG